MVPQINAAVPSQLTGNYPRQPCHSPVGVEQLSISGSSTPSSSKSQRIRSSPLLGHDPTAYRNSAWPTQEPFEGRPDTRLTMLPGPPKQANGSYSMAGSTDRRIGLVSSPPSADRLRASPLLPSMSGLRSLPQNGLYERDDADQVTLPSLFGNSRGLPPSYSPRDRPSLHDSRRDTTPTYPPMWDYDLPSPQSVSYTDFPYGQHRHSSEAGLVHSSMDGSSNHGSRNQQLNFEMVGDYPDNRNKRRRGNLPKAVTDILRSWFYDHISHPYPSEDEKQILMARTGLSISQVSPPAFPSVVLDR